MVIFLKNSDFTGQAVLRRVHDLPEPVRAVLRHVAYFICGMLFASASNLSAVSPFGVAFCAAAENKYILSAGLGAAAGYILPPGQHIVASTDSGERVCRSSRTRYERI